MASSLLRMRTLLTGSSRFPCQRIAAAHRVREHLATRREPGLEAMATAYAAVLDLPEQEPMRYELGTSTIDAQFAPRTAKTCMHSASAGNRMPKSSPCARKSERRGEWGHAQTAN